jgi:hypothetical protein
MENNLSASQLLAFQAISSFVSEANKVSGKTQKSLQLYNRLIEKTNISHKDAITKHINAFKTFVNANVDALKTQDVSKLTKITIDYSDRVFINTRLLLLNSSDNENIIWNHLITIGAIVHPKSNLKEILKEKREVEPESPESIEISDILANDGSPEDDVIANMMNKVQMSADPNTTDPNQAMQQLMSGGGLMDMVKDMTSGMQNGDLDISKMLGSLQKMTQKLGDMDGAPPEIQAMTGNLNQMINNVSQKVNDTKN